MDDTLFSVPADYGLFLNELKERIRSAQVRAALSVNSEMVLLYWGIGRRILAAQEIGGWGAKVVERLAADLRSEFPTMKGYSPRNLKYMRAFAEAWPERSIVQQPLAQLPWAHNLALLEKISTSERRLWYARAAIEYGWSRNVLVHQIEAQLFERRGQAISNFDRALPSPQSELAQQLLKDPYQFDFLGIGNDAREREIEKALVGHVRKFLLELGSGFAFVGNQYLLEVGGEDYFIDLLFYHLRLRCFVVIELKAGRFRPEYVGKLNFYLSVVDDLLRHPDDAPTIGLVLCKDKNRVVAEYALRGTTAPMGVAGYQMASSLPDPLKNSLPSIEAIQDTLSGPSE